MIYSDWNYLGVTIYSDCMELVGEANKLLISKTEELIENEELFSLLHSMEIKVQHISRNYNNGADQLARDGALRPKMITAWC